MKLMNSNCDS